MVASHSSPAAFAPSERCRIAVAADGSRAAIQEPAKVTVVELPSCAVVAELGTDSTATSCDLAWIGTPPRLLVLSRYASHGVAHLVDTDGPRTVAEIRVDAPMRLAAVAGSHALLIAPSSVAVLAVTGTGLTPYQFPTRALPLAAGAAGASFVVALPGAIEEWDPQNRMPKRRLKLPRPASITMVGGSERVVWMTTQQEPTRIEVIPFVNRGQAKAHELPEPIAAIASQPQSDMIACIGATSGRVWALDLDGRTGLRLTAGIERADAVALVLGRVAGILVAHAGRPLTIVPFDKLDTAVSHEGRASLFGLDDDGKLPAPSAVATPQAATPSVPASSSTAPSPGDAARSGKPAPVPATPRTDKPAPVPATPRTDKPPSAAEKAAALAAKRAAKPMAPSGDAPRGLGDSVPFVIANDRREHYAAFRQRMAQPARASQALGSMWPDAPAAWRNDVVTWTQNVCAHIATSSTSPASRSPESAAPAAREAHPTADPIETMTTRLDVSPELAPVVALLYGLHLLGRAGAAPVEVAFVAGGWEEALGRGELARRSVAIYRDSRVQLAPALCRALDDLPPLTGTLIGTPGLVTLLGPCAVVGTDALSSIAQACLPSIGGAILAGNEDADPGELVDEARAYGAAPMWRVRAERLARVPTDQPIILVVPDDVTVELLGVPRLK